MGELEEGGERNERKEERREGGELGEPCQYQPHTQVVLYLVSDPEPRKIEKGGGSVHRGMLGISEPSVASRTFC